MKRALDWLIRRVVVEGPSMLPTLRPGQRLTALRPWRRVRVGDIVVVRDPRDASRWIIKRCVARRASLIELRGDNAGASTDSRDFGPIPAKLVKYLIIGD
jgi:nickel-type superoxide dismutase maturation protease